jgi:hypothetical protein
MYLLSTILLRMLSVATVLRIITIHVAGLSHDEVKETDERVKVSEAVYIFLFH